MSGELRRVLTVEEDACRWYCTSIHGVKLESCEVVGRLQGEGASNVVSGALRILCIGYMSPKSSDQIVELVVHQAEQLMTHQPPGRASRSSSRP